MRPTACTVFTNLLIIRILPLLRDRDALDAHGLDGLVALGGRDALDRLDDVHPLDDLAEDGVRRRRRGLKVVEEGVVPVKSTSESRGRPRHRRDVKAQQNSICTAPYFVLRKNCEPPEFGAPVLAMEIVPTSFEISPRSSSGMLPPAMGNQPVISKSRR